MNDSNAGSQFWIEIITELMTEVAIAVATEFVIEIVIEFVTRHVEWNLPRDGTHRNMRSTNPIHFYEWAELNIFIFVCIYM